MAWQMVKYACNRWHIPFLMSADATNNEQRISDGYRMLVIDADTNADIGETERFGNRGPGRVLEYLRERAAQ